VCLAPVCVFGFAFIAENQDLHDVTRNRVSTVRVPCRAGVVQCQKGRGDAEVEIAATSLYLRVALDVIEAITVDAILNCSSRLVIP